jgi:transposase-like protein
VEQTGSSVEDQSARWSAQAKAALVLTVLRNQASTARVAAANGIAEAQVAAWVGAFVEAGKVGLRRGDPPGTARTAAAPAAPTRAALAEENRALRAALGKTRVEARIWQKAAEHKLGPFATLR